MDTTNKQSFIVDMPVDEYNESAKHGGRLTSPLLADFRACPLLYKQKISGEVEDPETETVRLKRELLTLVLGGREAFDERYAVAESPVNPRTGEPYGRTSKAYQEWLAEQTRPVVSKWAFEWMSKIERNVRLHPTARALLDRGCAGGVIRCDVDGEPCQVRMDWFNPDWGGKPAIVGVKTTDRIEYFDSTARNRGYVHELAFQCEVFRAASGGVLPKACLIVVEKCAPHRCGVWEIDEALLEQAIGENGAALEDLRDCRAADSWPTRFEDKRILKIIDND